MLTINECMKILPVDSKKQFGWCCTLQMSLSELKGWRCESLIKSPQNIRHEIERQQKSYDSLAIFLPWIEAWRLHGFEFPAAS